MCVNRDICVNNLAPAEVSVKRTTIVKMQRLFKTYYTVAEVVFFDPAGLRNI